MKIVELKPNRLLIKANFDGYKVSLEPIPIARTELTGSLGPDRVRPSHNQYSYLHATLYGLHNHLVRDPWSSGSCYYVDEAWNVRRVQYEEGSGKVKPLSSVLKLGKPRPRVDGDYNCSLLFISEKLALVADGQGGLRLVDTGDRRRGDEWKALYMFPAIDELKAGFVLMDGRLEVINEEIQIHVVCLSIEENKGKFRTVLHWLKIIQQESPEEWNHDSTHVMKSEGFPSYCYLEPKCGALVVVSDKSVKFVQDSQEPVVQEAGVSLEKKHDDAVPEKCLFSWTQSPEDITIKVPKEENVEYKITNAERKLKVFRDAALIIDGDALFGGIDGDLTTWTNESSELQVTLLKQPSGTIWPFLFPGSPEESGDRPAADLPPAPNLTSQLEECDFASSSQDTEYTIERLDVKKFSTSHKVCLGSTAPLFNATLKTGLPPALAMRLDVDACLWLQNPGENWNFRHEGTLHAFAYVLASKQQRKFVSCSPDLTYAIICESDRHVFIYKAHFNSASGLRNRKGAQISIGEQRLIRLEGAGEVLGISCENDYCILLTEMRLMVIQMCTEEE
ncbi:nudC domain-containing protein 1 [Toxorhynchites rutilus septentrionalis]|uniref:nudC domain-containing protein 1 n=1 Tax=Toxorhynchites rutilus septentrionalis TaxID=329112 RepID=UPI002479F371|nr:nudC domain-containing protein 1 [Toxorhynchites rutilus septentrionalis]